jgi:hypothetical protein
MLCGLPKLQFARDSILWACQGRQIAIDDDAIKAMVYKQEQTGKKVLEQFHGRISPG